MTSLLPRTSKVVFLDFGYFLHTAVFGWNISKPPFPATYTCLSMMLSNLKKVGIEPDDKVIVAIDGRGSWRRDLDPAYKANRKELKEKSDIDWKMWYGKFDDMVERLRHSSPFHFIRIDKLEADDIIAVGCKFYKDKECVVVSTDSDFEQLAAHKNVKLFSPKKKAYKVIDNPYKVLASKLKHEKTDNLLSPVLDEVDYQKRNMVVNLLTLPDEVEKIVVESLESLRDNSEYDLELFPFKKLKERFMEIYNDKAKVVDYEKSVKRKIKNKQKRKAGKNVQTNKEIF